MKNPFDTLRVTVNKDKAGNLCGLAGNQIPSKFSCRNGEQVYGALIVPLVEYQELWEAIRSGIMIGAIHHLSDCENTGFDEEPQRCSPKCLFKLLDEHRDSL